MLGVLNHPPAKRKNSQRFNLKFFSNSDNKRSEAAAAIQIVFEMQRKFSNNFNLLHYAMDGCGVYLVCWLWLGSMLFRPHVMA